MLAATHEYDRGFRSTALFVYVGNEMPPRLSHSGLPSRSSSTYVAERRAHSTLFCTAAAAVTAGHAYKRTYSYDYAELCIEDETEPNGAYFFTLATRRRRVTTKT